MRPELAAQAGGLERLLERLAREQELLAAHQAEWVTDGHPADGEMQAALRAAVSFGCALGLRRAAELIAAEDNE